MSAWDSDLLETTPGELRLATIVGIVTIPVVGLLYWVSVPDIALGAPVVVAGIVVGHRYCDRPTSSRRAGGRVGLAAAIPIVLLLSVAWSVELESRSIAIGTGVSLLAVGIFLNLLYYYASGVAGGMVGELLAKRSQQPRESTH